MHPLRDARTPPNPGAYLAMVARMYLDTDLAETSSPGTAVVNGVLARGCQEGRDVPKKS